MKVEEHIRRKERAEFERVPARHLVKPLFVMSTYERPGLLSRTVTSFQQTTPGETLHIFDDGSESKEKKDELDMLESSGGVLVHRLPHTGITGMWKKVFGFAQNAFGCDCLVLMEDDIVFSTAWLDVLASLAAHENLGMASCFRFHTDVTEKDFEIVNRIEVFRTNFSSFQVVLMPMDVVQDFDLLFLAASRSELEHSGLDVGLSKVLRDAGKDILVTVRSYVVHTGYDASIAKQYGYVYLPLKGVNLVYELCQKA